MLDVRPFDVHQVVDAGDVGVGPYDIAAAVDAIADRATELTTQGTRVVALGGDHTIALPLLRAAHAVHGPLAVLHFDAHLDTWDVLHGETLWHGSPFRRAAEEGLLALDSCQHVGIRGGVYGPSELEDDRRVGFALVHADEYQHRGVADIVEQVRSRLGDGPVYISVDIDVLDPAHAPGTGTPEVAGLSTRELFTTLRGLRGLDVVGADVVEVSPSYDHAGLTGLAAAHTAWELLSLMACRPAVASS